MPDVGVNLTQTRTASPSAGKRGASWRKWMVRAGVFAACLAFGFEAYRIFLGNNLHEIIPGQAYRSAQLTGKELERVVRTYGIRTVINLRGSCDPLPWFLEECRATHHLGVNQEDICFSSGRQPSTTEVRR